MHSFFGLCRYYPGCPDGIGFTEYDVAHVKWGGGWRMPTDAECDELLKYCYRTVIWQDECYGYEFRSLINGNTLFIPFAGFYDDVAYYGDPDKDAFGWYWTSTISESRNFDDGNATHLMIGPRFADDGITMLPNQYNAIIGASTRFTAGSVRPVLRPWDTPEPPVDYHIVPSLTDLRCQWQGEVVNVSIDANCEWTFSSQASWLTVEKTSDKQLTVSVSENTEASSRETEIKLYAVNNPDINASISVNQANKEVEPSGIYAILHHNGNSTVYYSETALQQAYDHAVNSDAIELSAGEFLSVDIQKSLTIRGVGWKPDNEKGRSTISGDFKLATNGTNGMTLTVRGVYNDGTITYGAGVSKVDVYDSRFYNVEPSDDTPATDFSFVKSKVQQLFRLSPKGKARFENSFIYDPHSVGGPGIEFVHSVIFNLSNELYNCRFVNSIIDCCLTVALDASNSISYCLSIGGDCTACFDNMDTSTSLTIPGHDMFKTFRAWGFTDEEDYQLTDEAASQYIGSDGTQIGINGGQHPYISNE